MEEILRQILSRMDSLESTMNKGLSEVNKKVVNLGDKIDAHDRSNKEEFRQMDRKLDGITEAVAKTMEDISELKDNYKGRQINQS